MPKPNATSSVKEMKDYIRTHKLNHPEVKLSMKKPQLIAGLKKAGHWSEQSRKLITNKGRPVPKGSHKMPDGTIMKDSSMKSKSRKLIKNKGRPVSKTPAKSGDMKGFLAGLADKY